MEIAKQVKGALDTNGSEIRTFFNIFESLGRTLEGPTPSYNDYNADIQQIQANKLALRIKNLNTIMA